jgi:hypothetical protein
MLRRTYLVGVTALAVFYYFFFGAGPSPSEYVDDLPWWRPWGTALHWPPLMGLAQMARAGFPKAWLPIGLGCLVPLVVFAIGWRVLRGAVSRAVLAFLCALMCVFVYYGLRAEQVWRFFEWRFLAVAASFCGVVIAILFAPSLYDAAQKRSRPVALLLALGALVGIFLLSTEVTGTNSSMQFNISPWPIVTLFGFLLVGAQIAALEASTAAVTLARTRIPGIGGALAGIAGGLVVAGIASEFIFSDARGRVSLVFLALVFGAVAAVLRLPEDAGRRGLLRLAIGAVILIAILGSAQVAGSFQRRTRDVTALQVLDALEAYKKGNGQYPDKLDGLVPKYLAAIPRPEIGLIRDEDDRFTYSNYGDSYALEFASVLWVQCQYSPPYEFASADPNEKEEEPDVPTKDDEAGGKPDVSAPKAPTEDDLALKATLAQHGLNGSWSCPKEPPKLW